MPFSKNYIKYRESKTIVVKIGGTVPFQKIYLPVDYELTNKLITGIEWAEGGKQIATTSVFGGVTYTMLNSTTTPNFTLTLVDHTNLMICENLVLSTLGLTAAQGKIRRFNARIQSDRSYVTNIITSFSPVAAAAVALTFYYN